MRSTNSNEPYLANKETEKRDRAIAEMDAKLKKLEVLLKAYDNSNTPSSKELSTTKKKRGSNGAKRKRSGQIGHTGNQQAQADEV